MHTVVTGLFDIDRENWICYERSIEEYLQYFANVLTLKCDMIIYCEAEIVDFVEKFRENHSTKFQTTVIATRLEDLIMCQYWDLMIDIQNDPEYGESHPFPLCPEISEPLYSLVVCSKLDLLYQGSKIAKTDYCIWLDAGYTHGTVDISAIDWHPESLYQTYGKISLINLCDMSEMIPEPKAFSDQYIDIINGGFIGGHKDTIRKAHTQYYKLIQEFLTQHRIKEDDQYYWTFMVYRYPELFNLINGDWYSAFDIK